MPEDEIRLVTPTQMVRIVNVGEPKALEPTAIDKVSGKEKWLGIDCGQPGEDYGVTQVFDTRNFAPPVSWNPSMELRNLGYTRNPATCGHARKKFTASSMRWRCSDCGVWA